MKELKYKIDDEVLIKGVISNIVFKDGEPSSYPYNISFNKDEEHLDYWSKFFNPECVVGKVEDFIKVGDDKKSYEQGLNDAWEMARKICMTINKGGLPTDQLEDIYDGYDLTDDIMKTFTAQEAINKYNAWKEYNDIKIGDIVEVEGNGTKELGILYREFNAAYCVLLPEYDVPQNVGKRDYTLRKVGESGLDIAGALAKIRDMEA